MGLADFAVNMTLKKVKEKFMDPNLEGIGKILEIKWADKKLLLIIELEGLEDKPISVEATDIKFAHDCSSVTVKTFKSNMPFLQTALERFVAGKAFDIPEGGARLAIMAAKPVLGL